MVTHRCIIKNNEIKLILCFTFAPKTGITDTVFLWYLQSTQWGSPRAMKYRLDTFVGTSILVAYGALSIKVTLRKRVQKPVIIIGVPPRYPNLVA